ncbi:TPA: hypothetical protein ACH3X3_006125 [Trebouxia sp. C0006]
MQLFLSTPLVCHYVSFHIAAEHSHLTVRNFLSCAKRVLRWWQTQAEKKHPSLVEGLQWLQTLNEQLFCDTKRQETRPTQPCQRVRGCCLLSGSIVLLGVWASLQEQSRVCSRHLACCLQQTVAHLGQRCSSSKEEAEDCYDDQENTVQATCKKGHQGDCII